MITTKQKCFLKNYVIRHECHLVLIDDCFQEINNLRMTKGDRMIVCKIVAVSEATKRQIIYRVRKSAGQRTEKRTVDGGRRTRVAKHVHRVTCIECNWDMQPQQQGRQHAARTKCDIRTDQFPSFIMSDT